MRFESDHRRHWQINILTHTHTHTSIEEVEETIKRTNNHTAFTTYERDEVYLAPARHQNNNKNKKRNEKNNRFKSFT